MEVDPKDRPKTAFTCQSGLFEFNVMPFGLTNAPSSFERLMEKILSGLQYDICLLYLDDIIIKSETFEEHLVNLGKVFDRLKTHCSPKAKSTECRFSLRTWPAPVVLGCTYLYIVFVSLLNLE